MKIRFFFSIFIVISLLSCNKQNYEPSLVLPDVGLSAEKIDQQIIAYAPIGWNDFSIGNRITIEVIANQNETVLFKPDNVKIYYWNEEKWLEIKNMASNHPSDFSFMLEPTKKSEQYLFSGSTSVLPDLNNLSGVIDLKIFVFGFIIKNGEETQEQVGAFVDVRLNP